MITRKRGDKDNSHSNSKDGEQESSEVVAEDTDLCKICFKVNLKEAPRSEVIELSTKHRFAKECMRKYLTVGLE